jgi:hypothetical protein
VESKNLGIYIQSQRQILIMDTLEELTKKSFPTYDEMAKAYASWLDSYTDSDTYIRDRVRGILTDFEIDGDNYGVPTLEDIVNSLCERLTDQK